MNNVIIERNIGKLVDVGISDILNNQDGSLTLVWGYNSKNTNVIRISECRDFLQIKKGTVLFLQAIPDVLRCGNHMYDYKMVLIGDTEIEWNLFGNEFTWDSKDLYRFVKAANLSNS